MECYEPLSSYFPFLLQYQDAQMQHHLTLLNQHLDYKVLVLIYKIQFVLDLEPINFHQGGIYSDALEPMDV